MARIVLDPDEVNQDRVVTVTDGTVVDLSQADRATLERIARQLHIHRTGYAHALQDAELADRVLTGDARLEDHAPLYLRVAALIEKARAGGRRAVADLDLDLLLQTSVWTSSSGATLELADMTPAHRRNLRGWLQRHSDALAERARAELDEHTLATVAPSEPWVAGTPLYRRLDGLIEQESGREHAQDQARQVARRIEFQNTGRWPEP